MAFQLDPSNKASIVVDAEGAKTLSITVLPSDPDVTESGGYMTSVTG